MKGSILIFLTCSIVSFILYGVCFFFVGDGAFSDDKFQRFSFWKWTLIYWISNISAMFIGIAVYILWGSG